MLPFIDCRQQIGCISLTEEYEHVKRLRAHIPQMQTISVSTTAVWKLTASATGISWK